MNEGKKFEQDFKNSVSKNCFFYRFKDGTASYYKTQEEMKADKNIRFQQRNICDCMLFESPYLLLLELKSTKSKSMSFSNIRENQITDLSKASMHQNIIPGMIFNFRSIEETYFLHIKHIEYYYYHADRKSYPLQFVRDNGLLINQRKLKVRFRYDIDDLIVRLI